VVIVQKELRSVSLNAQERYPLYTKDLLIVGPKILDAFPTTECRFWDMSGSTRLFWGWGQVQNNLYSDV